MVMGDKNILKTWIYQLSHLKMATMSEDLKD